MMIELRFIFLVLLQLATTEGTKEKICTYIDYIGKKINENSLNCTIDEACRQNRTFHISYLYFPPYFFKEMGGGPREKGYMQRPIEEILKRCCGPCVTFQQMHLFQNISEMTTSLMQSSDFIYPFFASTSTKMLFGYHYMPFMDVPEIIYITENKGVDMNAFVRKIYPITVSCILVSIVSGVICWMLETWGNPEQFPRPFFRGWFEGFWWSFVSMTTVGYGDKVPKSIPGRLFSVIWVSIGIITYGLLVGIVYAEVMVINSPPPPKIRDSVVGSLMYRDYDAQMVAGNGGSFVQNTELNPKDFYMDFLSLIVKLQKRTIDGIALDQYTFAYANSVLPNISARIVNGNKDYDSAFVTDPVSAIDFFLKNTLATSVYYQGAQLLTYGALVKDHHDFHYFKDIVKDKRLRDRAMLSVYWEHHTAKKSVGEDLLFSEKGHFFRSFLTVIAVIILVILILGFILDLKRAGYNVKQMFLQHQEHSNIHHTQVKPAANTEVM